MGFFHTIFLSAAFGLQDFRQSMETPPWGRFFAPCTGLGRCTGRSRRCRPLRQQGAASADEVRSGGGAAEAAPRSRALHRLCLGRRRCRILDTVYRFADPAENRCRGFSAGFSALLKHHQHILGLLCRKKAAEPRMDDLLAV